MIRASLTLSLWCLCVVVGLQTTRTSSENVETEQRLEEKREDLLWRVERNKSLRIRIEQQGIALDEGRDIRATTRDRGDSE